jgi:hypothetical protein
LDGLSGNTNGAPSVLPAAGGLLRVILLALARRQPPKVAINRFSGCGGEKVAQHRRRSNCEDAKQIARSSHPHRALSRASRMIDEPQSTLA